MTWLALALIKARGFARTFPLKVWLLIGAVLCVLAFGGYCAHEAREAEQARQAVEQAEAERKASSARETAAGERLNDTITIRDREKERSDATEALPDTRPSDRRFRRGCVQLRQQGTPERDIPESCRSGG